MRPTPLILHLALLDPVTWLRWTLLTVLRSFILFYMGAIFIYVILGWVIPPGYSPPMALLASICEPVLAPVRRMIPPIGGIDLSPLWVGLGVLCVLLRLRARGLEAHNNHLSDSRDVESTSRSRATGEDSYSLRARSARRATHRVSRMCAGA